MASEDQVRQYLAYWFQLGKPILIQGGKRQLLPKSVIYGDRYSPEFEDCWQQVIAPQAGDCYLDGTHQTIVQLLSSAWDIIDCARCTMPVPMPNLEMISPSCPCADIPGWPDTSVPLPRAPVSSRDRLQTIHQRLWSSPQDAASP